MSDRDPLAQELAHHGNSIDFSAFSGYLPNPDPVLKKAGKDMRVYREILTDNHVGAVESIRKAGVESLEWEIDPGEAQSRQAKFVSDLFRDLDVSKMIGQALEAVDFGYQPMEVMWKRVGQFDVPFAVEAKPPEWFHFSADGHLLLRTRDNWIGEEVPPYKFLLPRHRPTYQNPYGLPLCARAFWWVAFKKSGVKFWLLFAEKYGMPWPIGKVPPGSDQEKIAHTREALVNMVQDACAVIDNDSSVEFLRDGSLGSSSDLYRDLAAFCNEEISKAWLGQTLTTQIGETGGAKAAAETHYKVMGHLVRRDQKMVEQAMNQLIRWVVELNFGPNTVMPKFCMYEKEDVDKILAERDGKLYSLGVRFKPAYIAKTYGLDVEDFEVVEPAAPPGTEFNFAEREPEPGSGPKSVDHEAASISREALQQMAEGMLKPLWPVIESGETAPEKLAEALAAAYPKMDDHAFADALERAIFATEMYARFAAMEKEGA